MPIYEYECVECGTHFDLRQSVTGWPSAVCPNGHLSVRRRLSRPAIIFKGSGFYVTDYGRNGSAGASRSKKRETKDGQAGESKAPSTTGESGNDD